MKDWFWGTQKQCLIIFWVVEPPCHAHIFLPHAHFLFFQHQLGCHMSQTLEGFRIAPQNTRAKVWSWCFFCLSLLAGSPLCMAKLVWMLPVQPHPNPKEKIHNKETYKFKYELNIVFMVCSENGMRGNHDSISYNIKFLLALASVSHAPKGDFEGTNPIPTT